MGEYFKQALNKCIAPMGRYDKPPTSPEQQIVKRCIVILSTL